MNNKAIVVKVKKNPYGEITDVVLDNGNVYSISEAISMVDAGIIEGAGFDGNSSKVSTSEKISNVDKLDILD